MKKLSQLLTSIQPLKTIGDINIEITDLIRDSRQAREGVMFVAVKGVAVDSHRFIPEVVSAGARAIVCEDLPEVLHPGATYIQVKDSVIALAHLADEWFDHPSQHLRLVGVTGTNGKTTTATLLYEMAQFLGHKAGLLSTVRNIIGSRVEEAAQTTPDHLTLNRYLYEMVQDGCEYAFMEVSSHACVQRRIEGITFAGGIFTNLTRDHMDFHKTVDNYIAAKKMFFDAIVEARLDGTTLEVNRQVVEVKFAGDFNAYNLLSVYGAAVLLGFDPQQVLVKMSMLEPVSGRFQTLHSPRGYTAIVDYAHTPDALVNVLDTIRRVVGKTGHIITVCGCGGDRDTGKRPIMAREAAIRRDRVVLTSDNPRTEDPDEILRQMEVGLPDEARPTTLIITDRRQAIRTACQLAQSGDVVLVAGKGHEPYQEIQGVKHHFDDREQLQEVFAAEETK